MPVNVVYSETNKGKTTLAGRWHPNATVFGITASVEPQWRRVLGILPRAIYDWPHRQSPPVDASQADLYNMTHGLAGQSRRVFGIVAAEQAIKMHYGRYTDVCARKGVKRNADIDLRYAAEAFDAREQDVGIWIVPKNAAESVVFSRDAVIDDTQFLCRDARDAHFRTPESFEENGSGEIIAVDKSGIARNLQGRGSALSINKDVGDASAVFMGLLFQSLHQQLTDVNWLLTTHMRSGKEGETVVQMKGSKVVLDNRGGPEFMTRGQMSFLTGYADNSLMLRSEDEDNVAAKEMPWMYAPDSLVDFKTWLSYFNEGHPLRKAFFTKNRGPFWPESPGGPIGLYRGSGQTIVSDMRGFEWVGAIVDGMLAVAPESPVLNMMEWLELWATMADVGKRLFKGLRERDIRLSTLGSEEQKREGLGRFGCSYVGMTRFDIKAQLNWSLHEGYAAFVARTRRSKLLGADDLFE